MNEYAPTPSSPLDDEIPASYTPLSPQEQGERVNDALLLPELNNLPVVLRTFRFNLTTDGALMNGIDWGFNAKSVVVDNASGNWLFCTQINQFIPPWCHGMIRNIIGGAQTMNIAIQAPAGKTPAVTANQFLTLTVYSINQPPTDGFNAGSAP